MQQPTLYLMVGYAGSGKTTVAQLICKLTGATHIWADHERQQMFGRQAQESQASKELYRVLNKRVQTLLSEGKSVVFDTNFRFRRDRDNLRQIAAEQGANSVIIWVTTDKTIARQRATEQSETAPNRFFGNISQADFDRISHLQEPAEDERPIRIVGSGVTEAIVASALATNSKL